MDTAVVTTTKEYSYSTCGERYQGSFATEQEAITACIRENELVSGATFHVGENHHHTAHDFVDAYNIMEECIGAAGDTVGEAAEDWLTQLQYDKAVCAELEKLVGDWLQDREPVNFWSVDNTRIWRVADNGTAVPVGEC